MGLGSYSSTLARLLADTVRSQSIKCVTQHLEARRQSYASIRHHWLEIREATAGIPRWQRMHDHVNNLIATNDELAFKNHIAYRTWLDKTPPRILKINFKALYEATCQFIVSRTFF